MIVGTGISQLVEEPGKGMKFDLEDMQSDEAQWYLSLTEAQDQVGSLDAMEALQKAHPQLQQPSAESPSRLNPKPDGRPTRSQKSKIVAIEEIDDSGEETEEEDLIPYEKPDDDAEDEDEDPTLVQRNKPTAPV